MVFQTDDRVSLWLEVISRNFFCYSQGPQFSIWQEFSYDAVSMAPKQLSETWQCYSRNHFSWSGFSHSFPEVFFFFFFLTYQRHYLYFKEFIDKITYGCKTCLILVLKYHFEDYHKLQILIIIISMVASEKKKLISKIQPPSLPGVPRPHYRDHMWWGR